MLTNDELRGILINEARRLAGDKADDYPDVDEMMLQEVMALARAVERAAYERAAQLVERHADDYSESVFVIAELKATAFAIRALGADK